MGLFWTDEDAAYIRSRSSRYPAALDIELSWTLEVLADDRLVELSPYPNSRVGASGFIGFSPSAGTCWWSLLTATSTATCTA